MSELALILLCLVVSFASTTTAHGDEVIKGTLFHYECNEAVSDIWVKSGVEISTNFLGALSFLLFQF